jgi:hypothetical protein
MAQFLGKSFWENRLEFRLQAVEVIIIENRVNRCERVIVAEVAML